MISFTFHKYIDPEGVKKTIFTNSEGKLHNLNGPAVVYTNKENVVTYSVYYINGKHTKCHKS